jgi:hypothetical protein
MIAKVIEAIQAAEWRDQGQLMDIAKGGLKRPRTIAELINFFKRKQSWLRK